MESTRFGIRYRLSVVLLLSVLNSVAMAAAMIVLFTAVAQSPPSHVLDGVLNAQGLVDVAHDSMLTGNASNPATREAVRRALSDADRIIREIDSTLPSVEADLITYNQAASAFLATVEARPTADPQTDPRLVEDLKALRRAHHHLRGSMQLAISYPRPAWVEQAIPVLPWAMAWVLAVGAITMVGAWSLRSLISKPLAELAAAAGQLADGNLRARIPTDADAPEIAVLGRAMISARDSLVEALHEREARSAREKAIITHMSDGVLLVDHDGVVLQLNPKAEQILWQLVPIGVEPRAGHPVWRLVKEVDEEVLAARQPREIEAVRVAPGSEGKEARTWVSLALRPVPPLTKGAPGGWAIMLRDVTAARELDQMQREFLSVVTHELKTPLTAIEGYARLLLRGKAGPLEGRQLTFVETIANQSSVLRTMVQNLLDTSRLEDGNLPIDQQHVGLARIVEELAGTWRGGAATHEIELAVDVAGAGKARIDVDPFRLQQVVGNLVSNALKFTPRGGRITLRARAHGDDAIIEVEDTGRGIGPDKIPRIFDKFFQVERGDTRVAGGAGLGLYICKQLVEAMGGSISVRSQEGVGSCFTLLLPVVPQHPEGGDDHSEGELAATAGDQE